MHLPGTGVPQGCPLSGSIFACATVGLIRMLAEVIAEDQIFRFADDTAVIVDGVQQLAAIRRVFEVFREATGSEQRRTRTLSVCTGTS